VGREYPWVFRPGDFHDALLSNRGLVSRGRRRDAHRPARISCSKAHAVMSGSGESQESAWVVARVRGSACRIAGTVSGEWCVRAEGHGSGAAKNADACGLIRRRALCNGWRRRLGPVRGADHATTSTFEKSWLRARAPLAVRLAADGHLERVPDRAWGDRALGGARTRLWLLRHVAARHQHRDDDRHVPDGVPHSEKPEQGSSGARAET